MEGSEKMPKEPPVDLYAESTGTGWFVGIIVALALLAIGYLVFSANHHPRYVAPTASAHVKLSTGNGHGSATHIGDGYFLTAAHVVGDDDAAVVPVGTGTTALDVLWANKTYDIALLRGPADQFKSVPLVCSTPSVGSNAIAYGNPMDLDAISTTIRIAGEPRKAALWKVAVPVDGALAPGMSGGGIVSNDQLVGVTVGVSIASLGGLPSLYGVGFIVPSSVVCDLLGRT